MVAFLRRKDKDSTNQMVRPPDANTLGSGYRFTLKGSPRHYDDVCQIIEAGGGTLYFGEALTYERGAGVALWRIRSRDLSWIRDLYDWWAETERVEPIVTRFYLYLPSNLKYAAMDLRDHTPDEVIAFIEANAPQDNMGETSGSQ